MEKQGTRGLAQTELKPETKRAYKATITALRKAIKGFRQAEPSGVAKKPSRMLLAMCECERKIRIARATYEEAPIICGTCELPFVVEDDSDEIEAA